MSLALATLLYEWKRYSAAMAALAFSGLLVLAQVGMFHRHRQRDHRLHRPLARRPG